MRPRRREDHPLAQPSMTGDERRLVELLDAYAVANRIEISDVTREAVRDYQHGGHAMLNRVLWRSPSLYRGLSDIDLGRVARMRNSLDWLLAQSRSPGVVVWRGCPHGYGVDHRALAIGDVLVSKGFVSASVARSVAEGFLGKGDDCVLFRLVVPRGRAGLWVPAYGSETWNWQREFRLPRNCRILIRSTVVRDRCVMVDGEVI